MLRAEMSRRRRVGRDVLLQVFAMIGIGLLLYPQAADWFSARAHESVIAGYVSQVQSAPSAERQRVLDAAYAYNEQLSPGPLTDPYVSELEDSIIGSELYAAYEEMLRVSGTEAIGTLSYPGVGINLPIYHGTSGTVISSGVGHLYGTSLPVGVPGTRSVLTAHSGLVRAKLFSPLHEAGVGDVFWISVLGEEHHYRVEAIEIVDAEETESLAIVEGEDWVTLCTCTPIGVNSHRLLVHAQRTDAAAESIEDLGVGVGAGFPWWAMWFVAGSLAAGFILFRPRRWVAVRVDADRSRRASHSG